MARSITVRAFAKINLELRGLGGRPDGYHELRTTFPSIALTDTPTFQPTRGPFPTRLDDLGSVWVVVVVPEFGVSTKEAFGWWDQEFGSPERAAARTKASGRAVSAVSRTKASNDLQSVVAKRHPIISKLVRALNKEGA